MTTYLQQGEANGALAANRERQLKLWMHQSLQEMIAQKLAKPETQALIQQQEAPVAHRQKSPPEAAGEIFDQLFGA